MTAKNQTTNGSNALVGSSDLSKMQHQWKQSHLEKAGICIIGKWREIEKSSQKSIVSTKNALLNQ